MAEPGKLGAGKPHKGTSRQATYTLAGLLALIVSAPVAALEVAVPVGDSAWARPVVGAKNIAPATASAVSAWRALGNDPLSGNRAWLVMSATLPRTGGVFNAVRWGSNRGFG